MLTWIAATLLGALAPALIVAGWSASITILPLAFAATLGHAVILGLPVALIYKAMRWTRLSAVLAGGFIIGVIPASYLLWPMSTGLRTTASVGGVPTIVDGIPTWFGWMQYLQSLLMCGGMGSIGAFAFLLAFKWSGALPAIDRTAQDRSRAIWIAGSAIVASLAIAAIPTITKDRTCHNMHRDGRTSVRPQLIIDLDIARADWPRLTTFIEQFAAAHRMSFRNASQSRPGVVEVLGLSACTEDGRTITASEQLWASRNYAPLISGGAQIILYNLDETVRWQPLGRDLVDALNAEWVGKVRFRSPDGRLVPQPEIK